MYKKPYIIAEIGCNHKGDIEIAKQLIKTAKEFCGADAAKFQKRTTRELLSEAEYSAPHPNPDNSYGSTYGEHRDFLEFSPDQHKELKNFCEKLGIDYSTSVWDITSTKEIIALNPKFIKVPSGCNLNKNILTLLCDSYSGEIHISLGMTDLAEITKIYNYVKEKGRLKDTVFYSCTSGYPVPHEDICLLEISKLRDLFKDEVLAVGFSGHHLGIAADVAAYTLGAPYIERHFTLDRTWKGTDHAASLEPEGLRKLVRDLNNVHKALNYKPQEILNIEVVQRNKLKSNQIKW